MQNGKLPWLLANRSRHDGWANEIASEKIQPWQALRNKLSDLEDLLGVGEENSAGKKTKFQERWLSSIWGVVRIQDPSAKMYGVSWVLSIPVSFWCATWLDIVGVTIHSRSPPGILAGESSIPANQRMFWRLTIHSLIVYMLFFFSMIKSYMISQKYIVRYVYPI